jgi:DNA-binding MarR family transcriptional regulator
MEAVNMKTERTGAREMALSLATAWGRLERRLDGALSAVRGISFAEYRLLCVLAEAPGGSVSRVDLAAAVGLTPSGVTRALRPLEKLGIVRTERSERDARLALAALTDAGRELFADATSAVDDAMAGVLRHVTRREPTVVDLLDELGVD